MHTLEEVRAEYDRLDRLLGIDTSMIELRVSRRAVRQLGSFRVPTRGAGRMRITLSALIFADDAQFWDTVRHEYAHAAVHLLHPGEKHGHDRVWKRMCAVVGCDPKRLAPRAGEGRRAAAGAGEVHRPLRRLRRGEPLHPAGKGRGDAASRPRPEPAVQSLRRKPLHAAGAEKIRRMQGTCILQCVDKPCCLSSRAEA